METKTESLRAGFLRVVFWVFCPLVFGTLGAFAQSSITVLGTGNPAVDVPNVQNAVDNFDIIYLQGNFDFGDQFVQVSRPNVTLTAQALGDATITGVMFDQRTQGDPGKTNPFEGMIHVEGDGVTLPTGFTMTNLIFECENLNYRSTAVSIYNIEDPTNVTTIENNRIMDIAWNALGLHTAWVQGKIYVRNNEFSGFRPLITFPMGGGNSGELLEIGYNTFTDFHMAVLLQLHNMKVDVHHNQIDGGAAGILSNNWAYSEISPDPPYYPRDPEAEPLTTIRNNQISDCWALPIVLGNGAVSVNHLVTENTITGDSWGGIDWDPFNMYNTVANNDFSGGSFIYEQIWVMGVGHIVTDNVLGESLGIFPAITVAAVNYYGGDEGAPAPEDTYGVILKGNDYRNTGLPGWETGMGCVLLGENWNPDPAFPMRKVRDCLVFEQGRFPKGTGGASKQVMELIPPDGYAENNRIVGHPAAHLLDPGIGQILKEAREELMALLEEIRNEIEN